ncbi:MAG: 5-formyltetrahydrofolate cyclo-ligase [Thermodesulfobacteriota bacterium]
MNKESLRRRQEEGGDTEAGALSPGRLAEQVRRLAAYRPAGSLFVGPARVLRQVRINALGDGKHLVMPAAGLHDGFWALAPYTLSFAELAQAVTPQGVASRGQRLALSALAGRRIALLIGDSLAVDRRGVMVADGQGFFDLAVAILQAAGGLATPFTVVAVTGEFLAEDEIDDARPWDVRADVVIHPGGVTEMPAAGREPPALFWNALPPQRIRRITPLWQLSQGKRLSSAEKK